MGFPFMWVCGRKGSCSSSTVFLGVCCSLTSCDLAGGDIPDHTKNTRIYRYPEYLQSAGKNSPLLAAVIQDFVLDITLWASDTQSLLENIDYSVWCSVKNNSAS